MAKKYKDYKRNKEYDEIPEGMVAVGKQPDGTYVILNPDKTYSRVSANDSRVPKIASETVRSTLSFPSNNKGVDMWIGVTK